MIKLLAFLLVYFRMFRGVDMSDGSLAVRIRQDVHHTGGNSGLGIILDVWAIYTKVTGHGTSPGPHTAHCKHVNTNTS